MSFKKLLYLSLILATAVSVLIFPGKLIKINNIDCVSQYGPCGNELFSKLNAYKNKNLSQTLKGTKSILSSDLLINNFSIQFKLPDILRIDVILRKGKFAINKVGTQDYAIIDKDGTAIEIQNLTNLPVLRVSDNLPKPGEEVNERLLFALNITYDMYAFYQVRSAKINGDSLIIDISREPTVIFPLEGDKDALMGGLALIISRLNKISEDSKIEGISQIDLRFKNPIVR